MGFENGKLLRVAISATATGIQCVNTFHYDLVDANVDIPNNPQTLADTFRADVLPHFGILFTSDFQIGPVVVTEEKDPLDPTAPRGQWTSGAPFAGTRTITGDFLPFGCVVVSINRTASIGRRYTGRTFVGGGFAEIDQAGSVWGQSIIDLCNQFMNAIPRQPDLAEGPSTSTANFCVYSRTQRLQQRNPYASHVISTSCGNRVHFLRSRAPTS